MYYEFMSLSKDLCTKRCQLKLLNKVLKGHPVHYAFKASRKSRVLNRSGFK